VALSHAEIPETPVILALLGPNFLFCHYIMATESDRAAAGPGIRITPENAHVFASLVDWFIVGTGISYEGDFHNTGPERLACLLAFTHRRASPVACLTLRAGARARGPSCGD